MQIERWYHQQLTPEIFQSVLDAHIFKISVYCDRRMSGRVSRYLSQMVAPETQVERPSPIYKVASVSMCHMSPAGLQNHKFILAIILLGAHAYL